MRLPSKFRTFGSGFRSSKASNGAAARSLSYLLPAICCLSILSTALNAMVVVLKVEEFTYQTKTVAGLNMDPTPWHVFEPELFEEKLAPPPPAPAFLRRRRLRQELHRVTSLI